MKCILCNRESFFLSAHHKFPQSKLNLSLYGKKLIDDPRNIQTPVCIDCHSNKKNGLQIWNEFEFCITMGIEPKSKTGKEAYVRLKPPA